MAFSHKQRLVMLWTVLLTVPVILQVDAQLFTTGISPIRPWVYSFIAFIFLFLLILREKCRFIVTLRITREGMFLFLSYALYVVSQGFGLLSWHEIHSDARSYGFWSYTIFLLYFGFLTGAILNRNIHTFFACVLSIHIGLLVIDLYLLPISHSSAWGRASGTLMNPNGAAFVVTTLMVGAIRWDNGKIRYLEVAVVSMSGLGIAMTGSLGGFLAYVVAIAGIGVWWVVSAKKESTMLSRVVVSLLLGMGITTIGALAVMIQKFGFSFSLSDMTGSHSASERLYAAKQALELISETPFLGKGIGYVYSMDVGPHNMILRALVEGGGVGLLALVGLVVAFFWVAYVRKSYGLFVLGLALTTIAMTTHNLTEDRSVIVIVGMLLAASHNSRVNLKKPVLARVGFVTS